MSGVVVVWLLMSPFAVIGCLKGRYALGILGVFFVFGIPAILSATRLAREDSWWAQRYYDDEKLAKSRARYPSERQFRSALTL